MKHKIYAIIIIALLISSAANHIRQDTIISRQHRIIDKYNGLYNKLWDAFHDNYIPAVKDGMYKECRLIVWQSVNDGIYYVTDTITVKENQRIFILDKQ